ncbi:MAG: serine/threonine-protein kinase [Candidatus Solibacter sp.]
MTLEIGSTVGDYQIVAILGAGGMGQVYKVRNVISDRVEAMKVLLPDLVNQPDLADRFLREIKVQGSLEHPNIAALHTAVRADNQLLMLMEFVEGVTLDQRLKEGPLPPAQGLDCIMQVLLALEYAHGRGVVHRDIKPANMIVTPNGVVKLMDFGIARSTADHKLTQTGTTVGSLYYMSPEQIQGASEPDARSDLYSVGVSLYELVTGKRPFDGDSQFAIMSAHLQGTPIPPVKVDPKLPQLLNDVILMAVAKDAESRFQTAGALRNALGNVARDLNPAAAAAPAAAPPAPAKAVKRVQPEPVVSAAVSAATPPVQPESRRGLWMGLGAVAAVLGIVAIVALAPWKNTGAAPKVAAPAPASQMVPAPPAANTQPPVASQPVVTQPVVTQPDVQTPMTTPNVAAKRPSQAPTNKDFSRLIAPSPQQAAPQQPVQQPAAQPQQQSAPPPVQQQQPAAPVGPSRAELQQTREHLALLNVRAGGVRTSLQTLQRSQAASGLNLRGDMQDAANLMNTYLSGAEDAMHANDPAAARSFADKAEKQLEKLEKFLNR